METIRFLHTADLHLDSPFRGMAGLSHNEIKRLRDSTFEAFDRFIEYAERTKPDFVVIVGDLYDGEDRSLRAQLRFQNGMERLHEVSIPVVLSYGNHDHLSGSWTSLTLPSNVHVFSDRVERKELVIRGQSISLYGFSYPTRHVPEPMIDEYPDADDQEAYHIGLLHGSAKGDTTHAVYAPFTKEQLLAKRYDYWALGHIHLRQIIHSEPPIVYPGNIQGRHRKERGKKGFYDVTLSKQTASLQFIPVSPITFESLEVDCSSVRYGNDWLDSCQAVIDSFMEEHEHAVLDLILTNMSEEAGELFRQSSVEEWLEAIREHYKGTEPFVWIRSIEMMSAVDAEAYQPLIEPVLQTMQGWSASDWQAILQDVYSHARGARYLEKLSIEELKSIEQEAAALIAKEVTRRG